MLASFHIAEEGFDHRAEMPDVSGPDELPAETDIRASMLPMMPDPVRRYFERDRPIELRPVEYGRYLGEESKGTN